MIDPVQPVIAKLGHPDGGGSEGRPGLGMDMDDEYFKRIEKQSNSP